MADQSKTTTPKKTSIRPHMFDSAESASLWFDIFNGVLFLGALLVTVGTWGTIKTAGIKERFSDERITSNEAETKRAIADSDIAKRGAAEANARALEAQLALEKYKAPRKLSPEQQAAIVGKLKGFSGTEYDIAIHENDPEILDFVSLVEIVLSTAEWTELDWKGSGEGLIRGRGELIIRLGASVKNVVIGVNENQPRKLLEPAQALSDALMAVDIEATAGWHTPHEMSSTNANAIHLLIGRKQ